MAFPTVPVPFYSLDPFQDCSFLPLIEVGRGDHNPFDTYICMYVTSNRRQHAKSCLVQGSQLPSLLQYVSIVLQPVGGLVYCITVRDFHVIVPSSSPTEAKLTAILFPKGL
jgi:hypothetical protein